MTYKDLTNYDNIDDCLGKNGALVLLYLTTSDNYGHWCLVFKRNKNTLEFFDSYGKIIDEPLKYGSAKVRQNNNQILPHLTKLLYESGYNVEYNDYKLQSKDVTTCGRHCVVRLTCRDMSIDDYYKKVMMKYKKDFSPDDVVCFLTRFIYD